MIGTKPNDQTTPIGVFFAVSGKHHLRFKEDRKYAGTELTLLDYENEGVMKHLYNFLEPALFSKTKIGANSLVAGPHGLTFTWCGCYGLCLLTQTN